MKYLRSDWKEGRHEHFKLIAKNRRLLGNAATYNAAVWESEVNTECRQTNCCRKKKKKSRRYFKKIGENDSVEKIKEERQVETSYLKA